MATDINYDDHTFPGTDGLVLQTHDVQLSSLIAPHFHPGDIDIILTKDRPDLPDNARLVYVRRNDQISGWNSIHAEAVDPDYALSKSRE